MSAGRDHQVKISLSCSDTAAASTGFGHLIRAKLHFTFTRCCSVVLNGTTFGLGFLHTAIAQVNHPDQKNDLSRIRRKKLSGWRASARARSKGTCALAGEMIGFSLGVRGRSILSFRGSLLFTILDELE